MLCRNFKFFAEGFSFCQRENFSPPPESRYSGTSGLLLKRGLVVRELVDGDFVLRVFVAEAVLAYGFVNVDAGFCVECGV